MHLAADRPAVGARRLIFRQMLRFRRDLVQELADGEGVPERTPL